MATILQAAARSGHGLAPLGARLGDARDHEPPAAAARALVELVEALDEDLALLPASGVGADDCHAQHRRAGWNAPRTETRSVRGGPDPQMTRSGGSRPSRTARTLTATRTAIASRAF